MQRENDNTGGGGISPFQALCTSLAARIGCDNLMGIAIFWMWLAALIGMATAFAESTLAQVYKIRYTCGNACGGPAWYMANGLGLRWCSIAPWPAGGRLGAGEWLSASDFPRRTALSVL